jgi:hypothetical protein
VFSIPSLSGASGPYGYVKALPTSPDIQENTTEGGVDVDRKCSRGIDVLLKTYLFNGAFS